MAATISTERAFADCQRLATTHYENFSVLSWFLPRALRPHFSSVYAFCRHTDDLGDEDFLEDAPKDAPGGGRPPPSLSTEAPHSVRERPSSQPAQAGFVEPTAPLGASSGAFSPAERLARLDAWEADLRRCFGAGQPPEHPYLIALRETIQRFDLPAEPFLRLIEANRMDQRASRYPTCADLRRYCEHSANPVGRLVLMLYGYRDDERQRLSDAICTALQLTNFWQDVASDYQQRSRIYLPGEDMAHFGCDEAALACGEATPAFRALMCFEVERARHLFFEGLPLLARLDGLPRRAVALFALGGLEILVAIERHNYDVFAQRPTLSSRSKLWLMARVAVSKPGIRKV